MSEKTVYTIQLDSETRDEWTEFVEESDEFSSTSQLVRKSVAEQIQRAREQQSGEMSKEQKEAIDVFRSEIGRVLSVVEEIQSVSEEIEKSQIDPDKLREITFEGAKEANDYQTEDIKGLLNNGQD